MINTVIFDMDGTLLYTLEDLKNSTNFALKKFGFPEHSLKEIKEFVGGGVKRLIERAVPENTSAQIIDEVLHVFKTDYTKNMYNNTKPYNNIENLLLKLKEKKFKTAVVSNKFDIAVKELCEKYFLGLIDAAIGQCDDVPKKPAPEGILKVMKLIGAQPQNCIYAGDSDIDVLTAHNAGIQCIGVTWGYRDKNLLILAGADYIVDKPLEILDKISLK